MVTGDSRFAGSNSSYSDELSSTFKILIYIGNSGD